MNTEAFDKAYKILNKAQKEAVDNINGPVMVVAGPGTGKTQVLSLRIANILLKTDIGASGILCLTFTNSGVQAMKKRLHTYIGETAYDVKVSTFHSFAQKIVENNYQLLDFDTIPKIIDEQSSIILFDEILNNNEWEYLRPRSNPGMYFRDLKSLISLLKRESISSEDFITSIDKEIEIIKNDPSSISSRGESKGFLKKDAEKKIESLNRSKEAGLFFALYEKNKKQNNYMDYDDVILYALKIIKISDDVKLSICEESQYILIDEHQDSSGIQNNLLKEIWGNIDEPNIFVVGDDRQLIYGFGGASISYFEEFKHTFGTAHQIILTENYRSTQPILNVADVLLKSNIADGLLKSNIKDNNDIKLYPCEYERDEILLVGNLFKEKIKDGVLPENCALLVPKNKNVRSAVRILRDMGLPVASGDNISFFDFTETKTFFNLLKVISNPYDSVSLCDLLFVATSNVQALEVHDFLHKINPRNLSLNDLLSSFNDTNNLFSEKNNIKVLGKKIYKWIDLYQKTDLYTLIQVVGKEYFIDLAKDHTNLVHSIEVIRTYLHLATSEIEKNPNIKLSDFLDYISRLESYNHNIPIATIGESTGINVMTMHGSKGLEYDVVHIAHMNESTIMGTKNRGFVLPKSIDHILVTKDELTAKRELYVAITRARYFCSLSFANESFSGAQLELANILNNIPGTHIITKSIDDSIKIIMDDNPISYIENNTISENIGIKELTNIVKNQYTEKNVSATLLNNFFECPWKWYFNSFLQIPILKSESLLLGSVVHLSIENILNNKIKVNKKLLESIINSSLDKELVYEKLLRSRIENSANVILKNWINNYLPKIHPNYLTERSVSYHDKNFPHLKMYGRIDLTENYKDGIFVTDFKTGNSKTKNVIEKYDNDGRMSSLLRQLTMYSYLLSGQNISNSRLIFLEEDPKEKNSIYNKHITSEEIDLLVRDINDYDNDMSSGLWVDRPCNFKSYGLGKLECEFCEMAKIYKI